MQNTLAIAIADDDEIDRYMIKEVISRTGHSAVIEAESGEELLNALCEKAADLVISDVRMPGFDGWDLAEKVMTEFHLPVVLTSGACDENLLVKARKCGVANYLVKPVAETDVMATIALAIPMIDELGTLRKEVANARRSLQERKAIEKAKGIIMARMDKTEDDAFRHIQKIARNERSKLVEIAKRIIQADQLIPADAPGVAVTNR